MLSGSCSLRNLQRERLLCLFLPSDCLQTILGIPRITAAELQALPAEGKLEIWDGWNLILGAKKEAKDRDALFARAREHLAAHPADFVWIVLDGPDESVLNEGRLRISYTGGTGRHRADRFIVDFTRMAAYLGLSHKIIVRTNDKDFKRQCEKLSASFSRRPPRGR